MLSRNSQREAIFQVSAQKILVDKGARSGSATCISPRRRSLDRPGRGGARPVRFLPTILPTYLPTGYLGTYLPTTGYLGTYLPTYIPETCKPHTTIDEHHYQPDLSFLSFPPLFLPSPVFPRTLTSAAPIVIIVFTERGSRSEGPRQQSIGVDTYYRHTHTAPSL